MELLVFIIAVVALALIVYNETGKADRIKKAAREKKNEDRHSRILLKKSYIENAGPEWAYVSGEQGDFNFMLMTTDCSQLRFVQLGTTGDVREETTIDVADVFSVELKQDTATITKVETNTTSKKSGSLARAAVGGVAFGGAGAVVGAVSAGSKSKTTGTQTTSQVVKANKIVLGTMDPAKPTISQSFSSTNDAVDWYHRVMGAMRRSAQ